MSLAEVLILCPILFQALLMPIFSSHFSKARNLFEILIWYCHSTSTHLNFWRLRISTWSFFCSLAYQKSLIKFCNHQIVVGITENSSKRLDGKHTWMLLSIKKQSIWFCIFQVCVPPYLHNYIFWSSTVHCSDSIIITISGKLYPTVGFKIHSLPFCCTKISKENYVIHKELIK